MLANTFGKAALTLTKIFGSGGAALPGLIAEKIASDILGFYSQQTEGGVILMSGTNGKTTTSRLISLLIEEKCGKLVHNRSGSNLVRGLISAYLNDSDWRGRVNAEMSLLEVDEAVLPEAIRQTKPKYLILHNLFRDQLDRYGEVDSLVNKWLKAVKEDLPEECTLLVNGDDPNLAFLAQASGHKKIVYYGLDDLHLLTDTPSSTVDAFLSPASGTPLKYAGYYLSHLGVYTDPSNNFSRPKLDCKATEIIFDKNNNSCELDFISQTNTLHIKLPLPGLYNVYNALAAFSLAEQLEVNLLQASLNLIKLKGVFGRFETLAINGKEFVFCLIKNPVGASEVINTISQNASRFNLALFANDNFADGQDVSWYWDANFEKLSGLTESLVCSGLRGYDMAVRMKYAGFEGKNQVILDIEKAIKYIIDNNEPDIKPKTYILSTYTATIEVQKLLAKHKYKKSHWHE